MEWAEIVIHTSSEASDIVSELFIQAGALGTAIVDRNDIPDPALPHGYWELIDPALIDSMPEDVLVQGWFPLDSTLTDRLSMLSSSINHLKTLSLPFPLGSLVIVQKTVEEAAWANKWKEFYKPFKPGKVLVIKPTWEPYAPKAGEKIIEIDPGMAFGTGSHETTSMCLSFLEKYVTPQMKIADIGTGSGILAIGAALLGAKAVFAVDIDKTAVEVAQKNILANNLSGFITAYEGNLLDMTDQVFDLCVANIIADVICFLASPLKNRLANNGLFICSGIIKERGQEVEDCLLKEGYTLIEKRQEGEWHAMAWKK